MVPSTDASSTSEPTLGGRVDWRTVPDLDSLPPVPGQPAGCAWNFWGANDRLGTLNLLTPEVVASAAASEVRTGDRVQIDWGLDSVSVPLIGRKQMHHRLVDLHKEHGIYATDDEVHLNTQTSSQWDGFNHFAYQPTGQYYGGIHHEQVHRHDWKREENSMHHWCLSGGIAGRGVLVDWVRWWEQTQPTPVPAADSSYPIPLDQIKKVLEFQNTQIKPADILLLRTGVIRWCEQATEEEKRDAFTGEDCFPGFEPTEESKRWLWNNHFAAVAADNPSFEFGPHGGELFDLERLSQACEKNQRWSFFLTSAPYRVKGGIASSPNAICIF
ncbi:hypothetical protein ACQY0O_004501 [Thecaphora frezii]